MTTHQNADSKPVSETKPRRNWNGWDVFFIVAPIICIILVPLGGLLYICGRLNHHIGDVIIFMYPASIIFILYSFFTCIVKLFRHWRTSTCKKKITTIIEICISFVFFILLVVPYLVPIELPFEPLIKPFMYGFRDRVKSRSDISAIRDWLKTLDKKDLEYYSQHSNYDELPESVKVICGSVDFSTDQNGNPVLNCSFGRGFDHWGVEIGMEDTKITPSDYVSQAGYRMFVEPGFYIVAW